MITTARTELPYACRHGTSLRGGGSNVTGQPPLVEYVGTMY